MITAMKQILQTFFPVLMAANVSLLCAAPLAPLRVSDNHRFLVTTDGKPFFWPADTAWQLIHDLDEAKMRLALRGEGYAMVYTPTGRSLVIRMDKLPETHVRASWFDPRTGKTSVMGEFENRRQRTFEPPCDEAMGNDWLLLFELSP